MRLEELKSRLVEFFQVAYIAVKSYGLFPMLLTAAVGGPSILVISEAIIDGFKLVESLHWIVDGWNRLNRVIAIFLNPITKPVVNLLNSWGLSVQLNQHWQSLFWVLLMPAVSILKSVDIEVGRENPAYAKFTIWNILSTVFIYFLVCVPMAIGAFAAGLTPSENTWFNQSLMVFLPIITTALAYSPIAFLINGLDKGGKYTFRFFVQIRKTMVFILKSAGIACALGSIAAMLSFIPRVQQSALLLYTIMLFLLSIILLFRCVSKKTRSRTMLYSGMGILGSFTAAFAVIFANYFLIQFDAPIP